MVRGHSTIGPGGEVSDRTRVRKPLRWPGRLAIAGAALLAPGLVMFNLIPAAQTAGSVLNIIGVLLLLLAGLSRTIAEAIGKLRRSDGRKPGWLFYAVLWVFVALFAQTMLFLATGGGPAAYQVDVLNQKGTLGWLNPVPLILLIVFLIGCPGWLRTQISYARASELARGLYLTMYTSGALVATALYLCLEHFFGGPLAHVHPGPLVAATLAVVALLAPLYRMVVKAVWQYGLADLLDPAAWRARFHQVSEELDRAAAEPDE